MNALWLLSLFSLTLLSTAKGQESVELIPFHGSGETLQASTENGLSLAIKVENEYLNNVSRSVLMAETWLRAQVLANYPAKNVSTIIVGETLLCKQKEENNNMDLILHTIKNIHYSLTRWGLQNDIKVTVSFSSHCLDTKSETYYIEPLLHTLQELGSPYVVSTPPQHPHTLSDETLSLMKSHFTFMKKIGFFHLNKISMIVVGGGLRKENTFTGRKLLYVDYSKIIDPYPPRPTPTPNPQAQAPSSHSSPAYAAKSPLPPLVGTIIPPPNSFPFAPSMSPEFNPTSPPFLPSLAPMVNPAAPPFGPHLPPCNPSEGGGGGAGAPVEGGGGGVHDAVWCVAKPSVPQETLQEALDYACGEGAADCEAIAPQGSCYFPDNLVAHASYAFNSYWQKTKKSGGTCGFGGTAMLINSDPSYRHCRFVLA